MAERRLTEPSVLPAVPEEPPALAIRVKDEDYLQHLKTELPMFRALAEAIGATAGRSGFLTAGQYQAIAAVADALDALSPYPGLMHVLILEAALGHAAFKPSLVNLKKAAAQLTEQERFTLLEALLPLFQAQHLDAEEVLNEWCAALKVDRSRTEAQRRTLPQAEPGGNGLWERLFGAARETSRDRLLRQARLLNDEQLNAYLAKLPPAELGDDTKLLRQLEAASLRSYQAAERLLKSSAALEEQQALSERFMHIIEVLVDQLRQRLQSINDRLAFQSEMFREDLDAFLETALERVEVGMRDLLDGREDWGDPTLWKAFADHTMGRQILSEFTPLRNRYQRLFDQWHKEYDAFAREVEGVRIGVLESVDPRTFASLLPTSNRIANIQNRMSQLANWTLGVAATGTALTVGGMLVSFEATTAILTGLGAVLGPVGLAGAGAVIGGSVLWRYLSKPEARKRKTVQSKKEAIRRALEKMLAEEALNHDGLTEELARQFSEAAYRQYGPLVSSARLAVLKAKLENRLIRRVLEDTRRLALKSEG